MESKKLFEKYKNNIVKLQSRYIYPEIKNNGKEYDFHIKFIDKLGLIPNKSRFLPKIHVTKEDGSDYPEAEENYLVNNYFSYFWSLIKINLFNTTIDQQYNVGHVSTLKKRANNSNESIGSSLASGFIAGKDDGKIKGKGLFYPAIDVGDLYPGFFDDVDEPIFGADIHIIMTLKDNWNDPLFTAMKATKTRAKINIESCRLKVCYVEYDEVSTTKLLNELKQFSLSEKYLFNYKCFQCVEYRGLKDLNTLRLNLGEDFVFTREPEWAFVFFISDTAVNTQDEDPTQWKHADIKNIQILIGDEPYPNEQQNYDIANGDYHDLYYSSSDYDKALYGSGRMISEFHSIESFINYNCFYNFDLRNKPKNFSSIEKLPKTLIADSNKTFKGLNCYVVFVNEKTVAYDMVMNRTVIQYY